MSDEATAGQQFSAMAVEQVIPQSPADSPISAEPHETPMSESKDGVEASLGLPENVNIPADETAQKPDTVVSETESKGGAQAPLRSDVNSRVAAEAASQREGTDTVKPTKEDKIRYEMLLEKLEKHRTADRLDPTESFTFSDRLGLKFEEQQIDHWMKLLRDERLLVLQSYDYQVLRAAADTIVRTLALPRNQQLTFDSQVESRAEISLRGLLKYDYGAEALIVVWAHGGGASGFLTSLPSDTTEDRKRLFRQRIRILVTAPLGKLPASELGHRGYLYNLPYEEPHLRTKFPESYKELADEIRNLIKKKRWGTDEEAAFGLTLNLLQKNRIEQEIRERSRSSWRPDDRVIQGLQDRAPLENTVKFVGSYYASSSEEGDLSPDDFQRILFLLLGERTVETETSVVHPNMPTQFLLRKRVLAEEWRNDQQRLVRECGLTNQQSHSGSLRVSFEDPEQRAVLRQEYQTHFYWTFDDLFQRCLSAGLLFDPVELVRRKTAELLLVKLQANPAAHGRNLLPDILYATLAREGTAIPSLPLLLAGMDVSKMRRIRIGLFEVLSSLADSHAPSGESLAKLAAESIERLIEAGCHGLAWHLANRLRNNVAYAAFYPRTLKRLLDEGPQEFGDIPESAKENPSALRQITLQKVIESETSLVVLTAILNWVPPENEEWSSRSQYFALDLTLRLVESELKDSASAAILWLFDSESGDAGKFQSAFLRAIFHPALGAVIDNESDQQKEPSWILFLFFPPSLRMVEDPPFWPLFAAFKFLAGTAVRQAETAERFRMFAIVSWVLAAQQVGKDPKAIVRQFWRAIPKGARGTLRNLLSFMGETCLQASDLMNRTPTDRHRAVSRETLKSLREAIRLIGSLSTISSN